MAWLLEGLLKEYLLESNSILKQFKTNLTEGNLVNLRSLRSEKKVIQLFFSLEFLKVKQQELQLPFTSKTKIKSRMTITI